MKKNVLAKVFALVMMVVVMSIALVGCTPNRPDKFMAAFAVSEEQGFKIGEGALSIEVKFDGENVYVSMMGVETYIMKSGDTVEIYAKELLTGWTYIKAENASEYEEMLKDINEIKKEALNEFIAYTKDNEVDVKATDEKLAKMFAEEDGVWYTAVNGVAQKELGFFEIDGTDMKVMVGEGESALCMGTFSLKVDIKVPDAALEAKK